MSATVSFRVVGSVVWSEPTSAPPTTVPASLRRRVTPIGRKALEAAWAVLPLGGEAPRLVLSSRHGEYERTMGLLNSLADDGEVSPAEFSLAVHHALAGLLSIASRNHAGHTAIAAGTESFGYGLLEATACANADRRPTVLMHFDEPLPKEYADIDLPGEQAIAVALVVAPADFEQGERVTMTIAAGGGGGGSDLAASFMDFLGSERPAGECAGDRMKWQWRRV